MDTEMPRQNTAVGQKKPGFITGDYRERVPEVKSYWWSGSFRDGRAKTGISI